MLSCHVFVRNSLRSSLHHLLSRGSSISRVNFVGGQNDRDVLCQSNCYQSRRWHLWCFSFVCQRFSLCSCLLDLIVCRIKRIICLPITGLRAGSQASCRLSCISLGLFEGFLSARCPSIALNNASKRREAEITSIERQITGATVVLNWVM